MSSLKDASIPERPLQIYRLALRESYSVGELSRNGWIPLISNPARPLTKYMLSETSPFLLMATIRYLADPFGWASARLERKSSEFQKDI